MDEAPVGLTVDSTNAKQLKKHTIRPDTAARHKRKYENKNLFHRLALDRFVTCIAKEIAALKPRTTLDFGTGEGYFLQELAVRQVPLGQVVGIDLRAEAVEEARRRCPQHAFMQTDLLTWDRPERRFDLVIASQVLEHLPEPSIYLKRLCGLARRQLLLTVPWEPWFRLMNFFRGRDLTRFGNHPEHVNCWTFNQFKAFVGSEAEIEKAYTVLPFTIVLAKPLS
jgi:SAM-dependent methyltransferase